MRKNAPSALSFFGNKPSTARLNDSEESQSIGAVILNDSEESHSAGPVILNDSEESHSADKKILPPYSRQNDNAGKKKAASKRGPVILTIP